MAVFTRNIIGVDIDNVLSDTDFIIRQLIKQQYEIESTREQITDWMYSKSLQITLEQEYLIFDLFHNYYSLDAPTIPFAEESLKKLSSENLIWLITARPENTTVATKQWLHQHNIPYHKLIHSHNKISYSHNLKLFIEDRGETALEFANNNVPVILFSKPWNIKYNHPMIFRVFNWQEALGIIETFIIGS